MENLNHEEVRAHRRKAQNRKMVALVLTLLMIVGCVVGGTLAWLTDKTQEVTNVFTTSNIGVTLEETDTDPNKDGAQHEYKMIPGWVIEKDPEVMVDAMSEDCYLFIKVVKEKGVVTYTPAGEQTQKNTTWDDFLAAYIADGWTLLKGEKKGDGQISSAESVYYKVIDEAYDAATSDSSNAMKGVWYPILKDNQVKVKDTVTKEMMQAVAANVDKQPTLAFTAYAVQLWKTNESFDDPTTSDVNEAQFTPEQAWAEIK